MKFVRWFLGKIILFFDRVFAPQAPARSAEDQRRVQGAFANHSIYEFRACPFCVKVRRFLKREGIELPLKDAMREPARGELQAGGGKLQVPCLRIENGDGSVRWLYESSDIIQYLRERLPAATV